MNVLKYEHKIIIINDAIIPFHIRKKKKHHANLSFAVNFGKCIP